MVQIDNSIHELEMPLLLKFFVIYSVCSISSLGSYNLNLPSAEDRASFFNSLIDAALSVSLEGTSKKSLETDSLPELPKAPKLAGGLKVSELKATVEAEQHALRRLRMCLRDVCNRYVNK